MIAHEANLQQRGFYACSSSTFWKIDWLQFLMGQNIFFVSHLDHIQVITWRQPKTETVTRFLSWIKWLIARFSTYHMAQGVESLLSFLFVKLVTLKVWPCSSIKHRMRVPQGFSLWIPEQQYCWLCPATARFPNEEKNLTEEAKL